MNKKLITLAVAGAMVAPLAAAADTTLYGRIDTSLVYVDGDSVVFDYGNDTVTVNDNESEWDVETYTTRIGVKGSEDLGNGLKAIFQAEWAFSSSEGGSTAGGLNNRLAYAGLSGGFGTVAIGRQWTPYYGAVDKVDIFNNGAFNPTYLGTFRTGNAIAYVSPNFSGFVAKAAVVIDNDAVANDDNNIDAYNLAVQYDNGPLSLGLGYNKHKGIDNGVIDTDDIDGWGLGGSYNFGMFKVIAQYEDWDYGDLDMNEWTIAGEAYFGNHTFRALYGDVDFDIDSEDSWIVGWQYNFSKRTRVFAEYGDVAGTARDGAAQTVTVGDGDKFSFGLRHDF